MLACLLTPCGPAPSGTCRRTRPSRFSPLEATTPVAAPEAAAAISLPMRPAPPTGILAAMAAGGDGGVEVWGRAPSPTATGSPGGAVAPRRVEPNYQPSGALAAETNTVRGTVLKYTEPPEAKKPVKKWRLHVFKGSQQLEPLRVFRQSAYLFGRERLVADIPTDHPTCSKQHAVLQFRQVSVRNSTGQLEQEVKPYIIDLQSANGTLLNNERIEAQRYIELREGDCLKFGESTREYILLVEPDV